MSAATRSISTAISADFTERLNRVSPGATGHAVAIRAFDCYAGALRAADPVALNVELR